MNNLDRLLSHLNDTDCIDLVKELSERKMSLLPTKEINRERSNRIKALNLAELGREAHDNVIAGLLQWNDDLHQSHDICQDIHSSTGSYWHGIMHRREPDYWNGKYWFRKVGGHPVFSELAEAAISIAKDYPRHPDVERFARKLEHSWDPFHFIDLCEADEQSNDQHFEEFLIRVQREEIILLLIYSLRL